MTEEDVEVFEKSDYPDADEKQNLISGSKLLASGIPVLESLVDPRYVKKSLENLNISECYNCRRVSVWIYQSLLYPTIGDVDQPNPDMSDDIRRDYLEASVILNNSPRGAAALLRLAIQKLCKELGQPGENINDDIGALVKGGLDARVQKALDVVRVIGNYAVHPGQIDLRDDRSTAETLFKLLNLIIDKTISEPRHLDEVYASLPADKIKGIENRDRKRED